MPRNLLSNVTIYSIIGRYIGGKNPKFEYRNPKQTTNLNDQIYTACHKYVPK